MVLDLKLERSEVFANQTTIELGLHEGKKFTNSPHAAYLDGAKTEAEITQIWSTYKREIFTSNVQESLSA